MCKCIPTHMQLKTGKLTSAHRGRLESNSSFMFWQTPPVSQAESLRSVWSSSSLGWGWWVPCGASGSLTSTRKDFPWPALLPCVIYIKLLPFVRETDFFHLPCLAKQNAGIPFLFSVHKWRSWGHGDTAICWDPSSWHGHPGGDLAEVAQGR